MATTQGALYPTLIGPTPAEMDLFLNNGSSFNCNTTNSKFASRFTATTTKDIYAVTFKWFSVATAGTVIIEIWTVDATTGFPSAIYDANATYSATPVAGVQTYTFATPPSAGLTVGNEYALVLRCTGAGTTHQVRHGGAGALISKLPLQVLTQTDGATWVEGNGFNVGVFMCTFTLEDGSYDPMGHIPYDGQNVDALYVNAGAILGYAMKFVVPTGETWTPIGAQFSAQKNGTPAAGSNIRVRILDSGDSLVSNASRTLDFDSITTKLSARTAYAPFDQTVSLTAGTYRLVIDQPAGSTSSANCWRIYHGVALVSTDIASGISYSSCPDTATPVWTDNANATLGVCLWVDNITAAGGAAVLGAPNLRGFMQG